MNEFLYNAHQEFKRADHLLYVSLKYTRTGDVIRSVVERLVSTYGFIIDGLLEQAYDQREIEEIPKSPMEKVTTLRKILSHHGTFLEYMNFYVLLRKILRTDFEAHTEFRRHVTMVSKLEEPIDITIDIVSEYYHRTKEFLEYAKEQLFEHGSEEA